MSSFHRTEDKISSSLFSNLFEVDARPIQSLKRPGYRCHCTETSLKKKSSEEKNVVKDGNCRDIEDKNLPLPFFFFSTFDMRNSRLECIKININHFYLKSEYSGMIVNFYGLILKSW